MKTQPTDQQVQALQQSQNDSGGRLPILEKLDLLVNSTRNFPGLLEEAAKSLIISQLEKETIMSRFGTTKQQLTALYLLLNSKPCSPSKVFSLLNSTGNENVSAVFEEEEQRNTAAPPNLLSASEESSEQEKEDWRSLQKLIAGNIDRLSSHTRNLGLVLCFASGIGLITGKDREIIANYSQLEIDQLKKFYDCVSGKEGDAYGKLLKVLRMTSNNWALDVLEITD